MNWNESNTITPEVAGECYETRSLIKLFTDLEADGYTGLGLGLIIDLVRRDARQTNSAQLPCDDCGTPIDAETHAEELGMCVDCSWKFWGENC